MFGKYYMADYCNGVVTSLRDSAGAWVAANEGTFNAFDCSAFGEDVLGEMYFAGVSQNSVFRLGSGVCNPSAFITKDDTIRFCGDTLLLSTPAGTGFFYVWYKDGIGVQASASPVLAVTQSGGYHVVVSGANGCTAVSDTVYVDFQFAPEGSISGLPPLLCEQDPAVALTGMPPGGVFSGMGVSGNSFYPDSAGVATHVITYSYTGAGGCTATVSQKVVVQDCPTGTAEQQHLHALALYPNPTRGEVRLRCQAGAAARVDLLLTDLFGRTVYRNSFEAPAEQSAARFDLSGVSPGMYLYRLNAGKKTAAGKLVVQ
jgi:hypothetical protein